MLIRSPRTEEIAIVGIQAREARELALAADAVGLAVRPLEFGSPLADAALAAHGPGSIRLPLAIIAGRYSLQRPAFGAVLECIEVLRGTRQTLPAACVVLASTADLDGHETSLELGSLGSGDDGSPDALGDSLGRARTRDAPHRWPPCPSGSPANLRSSNSTSGRLKGTT